MLGEDPGQPKKRQADHREHGEGRQGGFHASPRVGLAVGFGVVVIDDGGGEVCDRDDV